VSAERKIIDLEIRIAHQDKLLAALDDVVRECSDRVRALEKQVVALREAGTSQPNVGPAHDPPPHY